MCLPASKYSLSLKVFIYIFLLKSSYAHSKVLVFTYGALHDHRSVCVSFAILTSPVCHLGLLIGA